MAERPGRRDEPGAGAGGRKEIDVGQRAGPKKIEVEISPIKAEDLASLDAVKKIEVASVKFTESINKMNVLLAKLHVDLLRLSASLGAYTENVQKNMRQHANVVSAINRQLDELAQRFEQISVVFRGFEEEAKRYVGEAISMLLLPVAVVKGFTESVQQTIATIVRLKNSVIAFDQAVIRSIDRLSVIAERGGVRGRLARVARIFPMAYAKITRHIPREFRRAFRRRLMEIDPSSLSRALGTGETLNEQRRISRFITIMTAGVLAINDMFVRLLRYVWEILVVQKLGAFFGFLRGGAEKILSAIGLTTVIGFLKGKLMLLATTIGGIASSIGSAVGGIASKIGAVLSSTAMGVASTVVVGLTAAGKVAEALGVNSEKLGVAVRALANKAEEAEKHGRNISAAFFRASSSIVSFAREVWIAGDQAKEWLSTNVPVIGGALGEIAQGLIHGVSVIITGVGALADILGEGVSRIEGFAGWVREGVAGFIDNIQTALSSFIGWASAGLRSLWEGFLTSLSMVVNWVSSAVRSIWDGIIRAFSWVSGRILEMMGTISRVWEGLVNSLRGIAEKLGLGGVFNQVSQAVGALGNMLQNAVSAIGGFIHALTGRNPGVIMHLEELGSALRRTSSTLYLQAGARAGSEGVYGSQLLNLIAELINEVRELRRDVAKSKPEVNVSIKTLESAYIRR